MNSNMLIDEIIKAKTPIIDPKASNALKWDVRGSMSMETATTIHGIWELVINPTTNKIYHFQFRGVNK